MHDPSGRKAAEQRALSGASQERPQPAETARLRLTESHYRAIFDSAHDFAILTTDLQGVITSWNTGAEKLLGWSDDEAVGEHACMIFTPEDQARDACDHEMRTADQCGRAEDERWHRRKDNSRFWASGLMMRFEDERTGQQVGYLKVIRDRTPQHEANERLGASEARYRQIVEGAEDFAIIALDDHGAITSWNSGAERITGYTAAEAIGQPGALIFTPEDRAAGAPDHELNRAHSDRRVPNERWHQKRDGTRFWGSGLTMRFDQPGGGYLKIFRDRTLEARTENQLRASEEFNRRVLASSSDCIKVLDLEGRVEFMSAGGMCIMEVDDFGAIDGACWTDFWKGEGHSSALAAVEEARRGGSARFQGFATTMKGNPRWWDVAVTPIGGSDGKPEKLLSVSRDITAIKQAEEALRETSRRLDAILANTREAVFLMDHRQHCAYANAAAEKLTGYTFAEMRGRALHDVVHHTRPDGSPYLLEDCPIDRAFPERAQMSGEELFVHKDGNFYPVAFTASPVLDDEGQPIGTVIEARNIAEEKARDEALRESEARLRKVLEIETVGVVFFDFVGGIRDANDAFLDLIGYTRAELEAGEVRYERLTPADWRWRDEKTIAELAATGKAEPFEKQYTRKDGSRISILCADKLLDEHTAVEFIIDVTERKQAEEALRESEARVRALTDNLPAGMVYQIATGADGSERRFLHVSQSHEKLTGVPAEAVIADPTIPYNLIVPEDREKLVRAEVEALRERQPFDVEVRFRRTDGALRWCRIISAPREQADGSLIWDGIQIDTTDQKAVEARLRELNETLEARVAQRSAELEQAHEQLRQSQKIEAMGQLTGGVSHDFNNLLSPIIGALDLLQRKEIGGERERRLIDGALQSAERARVLVQRLLAFARRQPLQPKPVDIGALVSGMADLVAATSGPQIKVQVDIAKGLPAAVADPNQVEMAILNLAVNARDAMPEGGTLRISAEAEMLEADPPGGLASGRYVRISVADTGTGMDDATMKRAIEPFFSTKGIGKGTGLGLSMVHGLAAQLGGALNISSKPGLGTNIVIWLPASDADAGAIPAAEEAAAPASASGTALLVDDEELVRMSTADMLAELGYSVVQARSAEEALKALERGLAPDLLVTDHLMPGMKGNELALEIRARLPELPVLLVSGYSEADGIAPDLSRLIKPFRQADLAAKLAELKDSPAP